MKKVNFKILGLTALITCVFFYLPLSLMICFVLWPALVVSLLLQIAHRKSTLWYDFPIVVVHFITIYFLFQFAPQGGLYQKIDMTNWNGKMLSDISESLEQQTGYAIKYGDFLKRRVDEPISFSDPQIVPFKKCLEILGEELNSSVQIDSFSLSLCGFYEHDKVIDFDPFYPQRNNAFASFIWIFIKPDYHYYQ